MTTEDLIAWVDGAISVREDSFIDSEKDADGNILVAGYYSLNHSQVLNATRPENAKDYDYSIAMWMIDYASDVEDWMKEIEFNRLAEEDKKTNEQISEHFKNKD